ncbi:MULTISPECIES: M28 family peptidase [unclassified Xanthomonas]|uniref:M28 family peptidase n=1 Tax=Xanthomonas sp. LMG 8992 TaxID=1591157 RepID=UPI00136E02FF|nr:M28 family peptidase [Xanthomonas sp. LMG 8992]
MTQPNVQADPKGNGKLTNITFIISVSLFIIFSALAKWRLEPISPATTTDADRFSAHRAFDVLTRILPQQLPHPVDSEENDKVRQRILDTLRAYGYQPDVQQATSCRKLRVYVCAKVENITALRKGSAEGQTLLLSAHYDSVDAGPGASDDGAGVSILLETARMLAQRPASRNSVRFLFTDGEEAGLLGAHAFATQSPLAARLAVAINIEARGTSGQSALFETGSTSGWLVDAFAASSVRPLANSLLNTAYALLPNDTDLTIFKSHGMQGVNFAYGDHMAYYHTPRDNLQSLNRGSLQQQGDHVYGLLISLLDRDIPAPEAMGRRVYTDIMGMGMVGWPANAGAGLAIALLGIFAFCHWRLALRLPIAWASIPTGFLLVVACAMTGGLVGYLLTTALSLASGRDPPWHSDTAANRLLLWTCVLVATLATQRTLRRWSNPEGSWIGMGYAWLAAGVLTALFLPGISYLFILPSIALSAAALLLLIAPRLRKASPLVLLLPASVAFAILLNATFLFEMLLGFNEAIGAVGMGVLIGLAASFLAPSMPTGTPSRTLRYGGVAMLLVVAGSAFFSISASAYDTEQPQAVNILYVQSADGDAHLVSSSASPPLAVARAMGTASMKPIFPESGETYLAAPVASMSLSPANVTVLRTEQTVTGRTTTIRIDADASIRRVGLFFPQAMGLHSIETGGQRMDYAGSLSSYGNYKVLNCRGRSCNGMQLTLAMASKRPSTVLVKSFSPLAKPASALANVRDSDAVPYQDGDQSVVISNVTL